MSGLVYLHIFDVEGTPGSTNLKGINKLLKKQKAEIETEKICIIKVLQWQWVEECQSYKQIVLPY